MDISYLLALQHFRETSGGILTPLMLLISNLLPVLLVIPVAIYWCLDKGTGCFILLNFAGSGLVNNTIKCTVCCYRPWIRSSAIHPVEGALKGATGYSFPSGHVQTTTSVLGSIAFLDRKRRRWFSALSFILIFLMAFSRNYLGVHTPQDVLVAFLETAAIIMINVRLTKDLQINGRWKLYLWIGILITLAVVVYITAKAYPLDYRDGVLLVDPNEMMTDTYGAAGDFLGFLIGLFAEKKFVKFKADGKKTEKLLRLVIGIIPFGFFYLFGIEGLCQVMGDHPGTLAGRFFASFYVMAVWPFVFSRLHRSKKI